MPFEQDINEAVLIRVTKYLNHKIRKPRQHLEGGGIKVVLGSDERIYLMAGEKDSPAKIAEATAILEGVTDTELSQQHAFNVVSTKGMVVMSADRMLQLNKAARQLAITVT